MRPRAAALIVVALLSACGGDGEGDLEAFCDAVQDLRETDPFEELTIASPEEMKTAFDELRSGADDVADHAPPEQRPRAEEFRDSVGALVDEMRGAGYDLRALDDLAYRSAVGDYLDAAVAVENSTDATCP